MTLDLRKGFGDYPEYKLFKFPDNSIKFELKNDTPIENVIVTLRSNDDIIALGLVRDVIHNIQNTSPFLTITYMMYQQDDRLFGMRESYGLKVISKFINSMNWKAVKVFHPHSDKVELIDNCIIADNTEFIQSCLTDISNPDLIWVIPDSGAFKTQFKQIQKLGHKDFITCMKSRNHETQEIETIVNCEDLYNKDCIIFDDICLGGNTFIQIAKKLKEKNCRHIYLAVSHGIFNKGVSDIFKEIDFIYTTDSVYLQDDWDSSAYLHKIVVHKL